MPKVAELADHYINQPPPQTGNPAADAVFQTAYQIRHWTSPGGILREATALSARDRKEATAGMTPSYTPRTYYQRPSYSYSSRRSLPSSLSYASSASAPYVRQRKRTRPSRSTYSRVGARSNSRRGILAYALGE